MNPLDSIFSIILSACDSLEASLLMYDPPPRSSSRSSHSPLAGIFLMLLTARIVLPQLLACCLIDSAVTIAGHRQRSRSAGIFCGLYFLSIALDCVYQMLCFSQCITSIYDHPVCSFWVVNFLFNIPLNVRI